MSQFENSSSFEPNDFGANLDCGAGRVATEEATMTEPKYRTYQRILTDEDLIRINKFPIAVVLGSDNISRQELLQEIVPRGFETVGDLRGKTLTDVFAETHVPNEHQIAFSKDLEQFGISLS